MEKITYSIQLVSKITDISIYTLRTWEKRYQAVVPARHLNGRREYSRSDLEMIWLLGDLVKLGFSIGKIVNYTKEQLKEVYKEHTGKAFNANKPKRLIDKSDESYTQAQFILLNALETYQLDIITKELYKLSKLLNAKQFALEILSPLMQKIGSKVMTGELSISQEHALSSLIKFHVGSLLYTPKSERKTKLTKILLTTPSEEMHEFGIIVASLLCHFYSIEFIFLGVNLPADAIAETLKATKFDMIILGSTYKNTQTHRNKLTQYIDELMELIPKKKKVILGGPKQIDKTVYDFYPNLFAIDSFIELDKYLVNLK